jgi:hypothetical protein
MKYDNGKGRWRRGRGPRFVPEIFVSFHKIYSFIATGLTPGGSRQYTFTYKQYTEQHNETEYTEYYIHNNNNT